MLRTFLPSVLVLLSLLLRLRFMLLVALVRDMLGARRTNDSMRLASRDDRLGTLALELMGAPAASSELTDRRVPAAEPRGRCGGTSLPDDSETELTSGELTLTRPMEMAAGSEVAAGSLPCAASSSSRSSEVAGVSAVSVPELEAEPLSESTTMGSSCSVAAVRATPPWSNSSSPSLLLSSRRPTEEELRLRSEEEARLQTELLLPFLLEELAPPPSEDAAPPPSDVAPPLSGQLFFTRLHQDCCWEEEEARQVEEEEVVVVVVEEPLPPPTATGVNEEEEEEVEAGPETVDETGLGDGAVAADSGSNPGANRRSNFPSAPIR